MVLRLAEAPSLRPPAGFGVAPGLATGTTVLRQAEAPSWKSYELVSRGRSGPGRARVALSLLSPFFFFFFFFLFFSLFFLSFFLFLFFFFFFFFLFFFFFSFFFSSFFLFFFFFFFSFSCFCSFSLSFFLFLLFFFLLTAFLSPLLSCCVFSFSSSHPRSACVNLRVYQLFLLVDLPEFLDYFEAAISACAMYMFMRAWCWPGTMAAGPPGPSAICAWSRAAITSACVSEPASVTAAAQSRSPRYRPEQALLR